MQDMNSMALVPVGPMMPGAIVPYGMMAGMPGAYPAGGLMTGSNPFNPFLSTPAGPAPTAQAFAAVKLANDPLNAITEELLGPPKAKTPTPTGPQPSLKDLKQRASSSQVPA